MKGLVARWLIQEMDKRNLAAKQLEAASGLSRGEIYNLCNEARQTPKIAICHILAEALGMHPAQLMIEAGLIPPLSQFQALGQFDAIDAELLKEITYLNPAVQKSLAGTLRAIRTGVAGNV